MGSVGIFGGAFNPPHNEHIRISAQLIEEYDLSKVVFVPTKDAPHKKTETPYDLRCEMIGIAIKDIPSLAVDQIEKDIQGITYSHIVLESLKDKYKDIVFIIGGDSMINFHSWKNSEKIIKICPLIVVPRGSVSDKLLSAVEHYRQQGAVIKISSTIGKDISSSLIRAHIEFGLDTTEYISPMVREYINNNGLYTTHRQMIDRVRQTMSLKRFEHTVSTALTAIKLNDTWGLDYDKVIIAALLHDCMKHNEKIHQGVPRDTLGTKVMHAFNGAIEAREEYGITDEDILNAIRYHTTGRPNMSKLEKLIYLADMIEPIRKYEGVDELRKIAYEDAEKGFFATLKSTYTHLTKSNREIYYLTTDCYNYYKGANK